MAETNIKVLKIELDTGTGALKVNEVTQSVDKATSSVKEFNREAKKTTKDGLNPMIDKTGLAGATVVELGRTISDANYGIRGMANNLSQLSTLFITLITTSGGFLNGVQAIGTALAGPLGLIIGFQTVITLIEGFAKQTDEAKKSVDSLTKSLEFQSRRLDFLGRFALGSADALSAMRREYKELDDFLSSLPEDEAQMAETINFAIKQQQELLKVRAEISRITKLLSEQPTQGQDPLTQKERNELTYDLVNAYEQESRVLKLLQPQQERGVDLTLKQVKARKKAIEALKFDRILIPRDDFGPQLDRFRKAFSLSLKIEDEYNFLSIAGEEKRVTEAVRLRKIENERKLSLLETERKQLIRNGVSTIGIDQEIANKRKEIELQSLEDTKDINRARLRDQQEIAEATLFALESVSIFIDTEYQRQLDIEENKTNNINNELKKRLANENLAKDERAKIQNQIAANDEKLRVKQEAIEKKRFQINKAASIATATINTYLAATDVLAREKMGVVGKIAAMTLVIGSGLLQVAAIARQKFVSSVSGLGASSSSGATTQGVQAPDFNIVGASPVNQIAEAISLAERQPLRAYVVSKDVTTAQSLERNIVSGASIG